MIQVFDTHRTMYRNAKLRAFSDESKTTRLNFFDMTDVDDSTVYNNIGNEVWTNENGYYVRSSDQQKVNCLAVEQDAIIEVSLDGGTNWPVQWILHAGDSGANGFRVKKLKYYNGENNLVTGDLNDSEITLPDYLLRSEATFDNVWSEEEVVVTDGSTTSWTNVAVTNWTHVITFRQIAVSGAKFVIEATLRAGQTILVNNASAFDILIATTDLSNPYTLKAGKIAFFFRAFEGGYLFKIVDDNNSDGPVTVSNERILVNAATSSGVTINIEHSGTIVYVEGTWNAGAAKHIIMNAGTGIATVTVINKSSDSFKFWFSRPNVSSSPVITIAVDKVTNVYVPRDPTSADIVSTTLSID